MQIYEKLKKRRLDLGLTLEQVADHCGVNSSTVARWESGEIENMRRDKIEKYAQALQVSPAVIMGWDVRPAASNLSKEERELVNALRGIDPETREAFYARLMAYYSAYKQAAKIKKELTGGDDNV
jgi:transcriptional regulator with XRE-family HTH domain